MRMRCVFFVMCVFLCAEDGFARDAHRFMPLQDAKRMPVTYRMPQQTRQFMQLPARAPHMLLSPSVSEEQHLAPVPVEKEDTAATEPLHNDAILAIFAPTEP